MTWLRSALACLAIGLCVALGCGGAAFQPSGDGTGDSGGGSLPDSSTTNTQPDSSVGDPPDGGTGVTPVGCKPVRQCGDDGAHCGSVPDGCNTPSIAARAPQVKPVKRAPAMRKRSAEMALAIPEKLRVVPQRLHLHLRLQHGNVLCAQLRREDLRRRRLRREMRTRVWRYGAL